VDLFRNTNSLCPECYREIPALVFIRKDGVVMRKHCPVHGEFKSLVERDPLFYQAVLGSKSIYEGYFVDVTRRCNLRCEYCYFPLEHQDPEGMFTIPKVLSDCAANVRYAPFVLTGGEPTTRPDIVELVRSVKTVGPTEMLTNGVRLADPAFFDTLVPYLVREKGVTSVHLSVHPETELWQDTFNLFNARGLKAGSALIVIDSKEQFVKALETAQEYGRDALCFRIKAASRIWNEQKPGATTDQDTSKVFASDMLNWLDEMGGYRLITLTGNKSVFVNVEWRGIWLMLVSWHDVGNVDLLDIDCPPYYRARNGQVANFVTAGLINEGMQKGFINGQRIENDTPEPVEVAVA
jgi:hypothetical protein